MEPGVPGSSPGGGTIREGRRVAAVAQIGCARQGATMAVNVFVSVGKCFRPEQEQFVSAVEEHLRRNGMRPRTLGRNEFDADQPLRAVRRLMQSSQGAVIIALERIRIQQGAEKGEQPLANVALATPWNQIEATMAYMLKLPMLVLKERGVKSEGMLDHYDWLVQEVDVVPTLVDQKEFSGAFESWKKSVRKSRLFA